MRPPASPSMYHHRLDQSPPGPADVSSLRSHQQLSVAIPANGERSVVAYFPEGSRDQRQGDSHACTNPAQRRRSSPGNADPRGGLVARVARETWSVAARFGRKGRRRLLYHRVTARKWPRPHPVGLLSDLGRCLGRPAGRIRPQDVSDHDPLTDVCLRGSVTYWRPRRMSVASATAPSSLARRSTSSRLRQSTDVVSCSAPFVR